VLTISQGYAQQAGSRVFSFLELPSSAFQAGVGNVSATYQGHNPSMMLANPASLSMNEGKWASISTSFLPASTNMSSLYYTQNIKKVGQLGVSFRYISFGKIQGYDASGQRTRQFTPSAFSLAITHARKFGHFVIGSTVDVIHSTIDAYGATGLLLNLGGMFVHPTMDLTVGAVVKNVGFILSDFSETSNSSVPAELQVGASIKPEHMPVRFTLTLQRLNQWNLQSPQEKINEPNQGLDNAFRHVVIGSEIILSRHVHALFSYNHLRRKELKIEEKRGFSGFAIGFLASIWSYDLTYSFSGYHVSGNVNTITLTGNLSDITFKKKTNG